MTRVPAQTEMRDVKFTEVSLRPPDVSSIADTILSQALDFCAQKLNFDNPNAVVDYLRQGDYTAYTYWRYALAKEVAEHLGAWIEDTKAVYFYDHDATPEDSCFAEVPPEPLVHIFVWARRKTAALRSFSEAIDQAFVQSFCELMQTHQPEHLLDIQVVDDHDVDNRRGYGALLTSLHNRPLLVWKR